jgi:cyclopropane-fatty-acyl-phospholipid synthase
MAMITGPLFGAASTILNSVATQAWEPLVSLCRNATLSQLQKIRIGKLAVYESSSSKASANFGVEKEGLPLAVLNVHDERFWVRLALFADMVLLTCCLRNTADIS